MSRNKENIALPAARRGNNPVYNLGRTPPSDDFFTDSLLDASKIPTPSPTRPLTGAEQPYKPRRAIGTTKALKAAWDVSAKPPRKSSSGSDVARPRSQQLKPTPTQSLKHSPTLARKQTLKTLTLTPTPPRRSLPELGSPASESSPPKGLEDTYQRIADEENLAAQEGEILDEEDYTEDSMAAGGVHLTTDRAVLHRIRQSQSPNSAPDSRRRSPEARLADANKENRRHDASTALSEASGMSFLQGLTDQDLAAKLTPHTVDRAKDRARLERALQKDSPIAFSRAHTRKYSNAEKEKVQKDSPVAFSRAYTKPKAGLSPENTQNVYGTDDNEEPTEGSSVGSATTAGSQPPPNVPRTWGSKGKVGKDWLNRIHGRNSGPGNSATNIPMPESSQIDWTAAAAEVPLPSVEGTSTPKNFSPAAPMPATLNKQSSLEKIQEWDLNDFTGQSLQVSNTPPVKVRTNVLDQLRNQEIESLEKRAVTTNRLGEIRKKDSRELLRKVSRSPSLGPTKRELQEAGASHKARGVNFEDEGEAIPDTPIVVYKGTSSRTTSDSETGKENRRPPHDRQDSRNTLQKLARAMSDSPRTSSSPEDWSLVGKFDALDRKPVFANNESVDPTLHLDLSRKSSKQVADVESTPQGLKAGDYAKTPVVTGAWTDTILPDTVKTTKRQNEPAKYSETPHVGAGGWIDTPLPSDKRQPSALAPMRVEDIPAGLTDGLGGNQEQPAPANRSSSPDTKNVQKVKGIPKSALAGLLDKAKQKLTVQDAAIVRESNDTLNLGDATIESLEDLLTLDNTDMTTLIRMGAEYEAREQLIKGDSRNDDLLEAELLERLGSKLDRLRINIHDARKGISKLEHQVSHQDPSASNKALEVVGPCEACGCPRNGVDWSRSTTSSKLYLAIPIPRFFYEQRKDAGHWLPRPTPLGWATIAFATWYLSESTMCGYYCHPLYADFYEWPEEPEPRFGYALPTMLWRWSRIREFGPVLLGPIWFILVAFVRIVGQALGLSDGFVDNLPTKSKGFSNPAPMDGGGSPAGRGPDLSMMHDEFI